MKILYFGTICDPVKYDKMLAKCKMKPSLAPMVFEMALMNGLKENQAEVSIASFPIVPSFPKSNVLFWGNRKESLSSGYQCTWLATINITGIKQLSQKISSARYIKRYLREHAGEQKAVLIYSIYEPVASSIIKYCKKFSTPCFAIVPDLPRDMYSHMRINQLKKWLSEFYVKKALRIQGQFDGYVYLTEEMSKVICSEAAYTIVEGIYGAETSTPPDPKEKEEVPAIMYAGALHEKYGIKNLIESFLSVKTKAQLWLFGYGDYVQEIERYAKQNPEIHYFGRVSHAEVLKHERRASLLVNLRNADDAFTKYSFPSKTIEYMGSGTPLLTTKLSGIPKDYFDYCYTISNHSVEEITLELKRILSLHEEERCAFGSRAQSFILANKTPKQQSLKIMQFIQEMTRNA